MKKIIVSLIFFTTISLAQGSWIEQISGVSVSLNSAVSSNWLNHAWVCGNNGTVLRTVNLGTNWINVSGNGIPANMNLDVISASQTNSAGAFVCGVKNDTAIVYRTSNNGANWNVVFRQFNGRINGIKIGYQYGFLCGNPVGGRWSVWKSTNDGLTWDSAGLYIQQNNSESGWKNSFAYTTDNIFFGTNNNRMYISTNNGVNWTYKTFSNLQSITAMSFSSYSPGIYNGYIAGPGRIFFTSNSGSTWVSDSLMPGSGNVNGIINQPLPVDLLGYYNLFITRGDNKINFLSTTSGNWQLSYTAPSGNYNHLSNGMPFDYFAVRDNGGISYCGCHIIGIVQTENGIPLDYGLSQNYPNPFNPVTNISFSIPLLRGVTAEGGQGVFVKLTVFDLLGREIAALVNQQMQPGSYNVDWDASNYPSGVYLYKIEAGDFVESKKMILLK